MFGVSVEREGGNSTVTLDRQSEADYKRISERLRRYSEALIAYKLDADFADAVMEAANELERLANG